MRKDGARRAGHRAAAYPGRLRAREAARTGREEEWEAQRLAHRSHAPSRKGSRNGSRDGESVGEVHREYSLAEWAALGY
jgi:hypothetical protein